MLESILEFDDSSCRRMTDNLHEKKGCQKLANEDRQKKLVESSSKAETKISCWKIGQHQLREKRHLKINCHYGQQKIIS